MSLDKNMAMVPWNFRWGETTVNLRNELFPRTLVSTDHVRLLISSQVLQLILKCVNYWNPALLEFPSQSCIGQHIPLENKVHVLCITCRMRNRQTSKLSKIKRRCGAHPGMLCWTCTIIGRETRWAANRLQPRTTSSKAPARTFDEMCL